MKNDKQKAIEKELTSIAKKTSWDDLAYQIMQLEISIKHLDDPKYLELFKIKLDIFQKEKEERLEKSFSMDYFLNKDFKEFGVDFY